MFSQILSNVSILFIGLLIGGVARHKELLTEDSTLALGKLVLAVTLPFLYFYSLATQFTLELLKTIWILPVCAVLMVTLGYLLAKFFSIFLKLNPEGRATFIYLSTFTNCGFLAIPVAYALYGSEGIVRVVFFNLGFKVLYWTLGVWTLSNSKAAISSNSNRGIFFAAKNLINGGTIGLLCGVIAGLVALKLPYFLLESSKMIGSATIPLALLVTGSIMSNGGAKKLRAYKGALILVALCRLVIVPSIALLVTGLFGTMPPLVRAVIVLQAAMPSASTTPIFTSRFGGDSQLASAGVFVTHMLSIITIPIFISLL